MPSIPSTPATTPGGLRTPFHDAPTGGGKRYQLKASGAPRSRLARIAQSAVRKAQRLFVAVAPGAVRAETRYRVALRDCSHRVGDLFGAIAITDVRRTGVDVLEGALSRCEQALAVMAALAGKTPSQARQILAARAELHLAAMASQELGILRQRLAAITEDAVGSHAHPTYVQLANAVDQAIRDRQCSTVDHLLHTLTGTAPHDAIHPALAACEQAALAGRSIAGSPLIDMPFDAVLPTMLSRFDANGLSALRSNLQRLCASDSEWATLPLLQTVLEASNRLSAPKAPAAAPDPASAAAAEARDQAAAQVLAQSPTYATKAAFFDATDAVLEHLNDLQRPAQGRPEEAANDAPLHALINSLLKAGQCWVELQPLASSAGPAQQGNATQAQLGLLQAELQRLPAAVFQAALPGQTVVDTQIALRHALGQLGMRLQEAGNGQGD
jgi:hypothetical protein